MRRRNREKSEATYDPTRRKKRYSNFHRARKWHRKFRNTLFNPEGVWVERVNHRSDLYYKYMEKAERTDGVMIDCTGISSRAKLIIIGHHGPTSKLVEECKVSVDLESTDQSGQHLIVVSDSSGCDHLSETLE